LISQSWSIASKKPSQVLRLRRAGVLLACSAARRMAFPSTLRGRHTGEVISELNGWPACASCRCYTCSVAAAGVRLEVAVAG
jgi:hypothetical protein